MKKITVFLILSLLTCPAISEDVAPWPDRDPILIPTCEWDFMDESFSIPDGLSGINNFPYGTPMIMTLGSDIIYIPSTGPGPGGAISFMDLFMEIPIASSQSRYYCKARVQITYDTNYGCPDVFIYSDTARGGVIYEETILLPDSPWAVKVRDIWGDEFHGLLFLYNESNENAPIVSEIVVDMIPEPSTMLLFAFGGLMLRKR